MFGAPLNGGSLLGEKHLLEVSPFRRDPKTRPCLIVQFVQQTVAKALKELSKVVLQSTAMLLQRSDLERLSKQLR